MAPEVIRVFVGCAPNGEDAESQAALEYTLRSHASLPVDITWMQLSRDPKSQFYSDGLQGWQSGNWSTPFSPFRYIVPALCGYEGRAIYCDSDLIFMSDVAELWNQEFAPGKCVMAKFEGRAKRLCVSLWDCAAAKEFVPASRFPGGAELTRTRHEIAPAVQAYRGNWNCIDGEDYASLDDPNIKAIHYSLESAQPHLRYAVPRLKKAGLKHWFDGKTRPHWRGDLVRLFDQLYADAILAGYTAERYIPPKPFGNYTLKSHANYGVHKWVDGLRVA